MLTIFRKHKYLKSFAIIVLSIFISEIMAMGIIYLLNVSSMWILILLDACILTLLVIPFLYVFSLRPMENQIAELDKAENTLQDVVSKQERLITDRTRELAEANQQLKHEIEVRKRVEEILRASLVDSERREEEVTALLNSAREVLESNEFEISSRKIFDACKKLIGAEAGYVALVEDYENSVVFLDTGTYECTVDLDLPMPIRGMREDVYIHGQTLFENDFLSTPWVKFLPRGHTETRNVLFAPLSIKGVVVGLMGLANKEGGFDDRDASLASAFAEIAAVALLNSSSIRALRASQEQLEQRVEERTQVIEDKNVELLAEIVERRRVEKQLRTQTAALEAAANGIIITDIDGNIVWSNEAFSAMTGYAPSEILGRSPSFLKSDKHPAEFYQALWQTVLGGQNWHGETINRRKDGSLYTEYQTITPVIGEDGKIVNFIAIKQDITQRKQFELKLEETNRELLSLSQSEHKQRRFAETLYEASSTMSRTLDLEIVAESLFDYLERIIKYDAAYVVLAKEESRLSVRSGRQSAQFPGTTEDINTLLEPFMESALQKELFGDSVVIVPDVREIDGWGSLTLREYIRGWLCIPLKATDKVFGLVILVKTEPGEFDPEHSHLAESLVNQAAIAIQNSWLFEQVRAGHERQQMLSRRLVEVQETERREIARELHDETSQTMTSLRLGLRMLERDAAEPEKVIDHVKGLREVSEEVMESLHQLAMNLRPASLDHLGLITTTKNLVETFGVKHGFKAQFRDIGFSDGPMPGEEIEVPLYRIVQEALTNVVRHAQASRVDVIMEMRRDEILLIVEDDGVGFNPDVIGENDRLGLLGIQERIEQLGGKFIIESQPGQGTTLVAEVPCGH